MTREGSTGHCWVSASGGAAQGEWTGRLPRVLEECGLFLRGPGGPGLVLENQPLHCARQPYSIQAGPVPVGPVSTLQWGDRVCGPSVSSVLGRSAGQCFFGAGSGADVEPGGRGGHASPPF